MDGMKRGIEEIMRSLGSRRAVPVPSDLPAIPGTTSEPSVPVCPLCKDGKFLKKYLNGQNIDDGMELIPCDCTSFDRKHRAWVRARDTSGLARILHDKTFTQFKRELQPEAYDAAKAFAAQPDLYWLMLIGDVGTGKTNLAAAIVTALLTTEWHPLYAVVPDMLRHLRAGFDSGEHDQRWRDLRDAEVLILDDYGAEARTEWTDETMFTLIDYRYASRKPTVMMTNLTVAQLPPRIASRMCDAANSHVVTMRPGDYRLSDARYEEREQLRYTPADVYA